MPLNYPRLNSTLSTKIEELNAQISTLYVENLRLRASEIALASQLKREQAKSQKIMADADSAVRIADIPISPALICNLQIANLAKHFGFLRDSFNIPLCAPSPPSRDPPPPRARRRVPDPNASPPIPRLSRAPNVPGIFEEDEEDSPSEEPPSPTSAIRRKHKPRHSGSGSSSSSRLPLPTRAMSPPAADLEEQLARRRRPTRRPSGLISKVSSESSSLSVPERPLSPAFGSPVRREAGLAEAAEEAAVADTAVELDDDIDEVVVLPRMARKDKDRSGDREKERKSKSSRGSSSGSVQERKRSHGVEEDLGPSPEPKPKHKFKDVTNSPRARSREKVPTNVLAVAMKELGSQRQRTPDVDADAIFGTRTFLTTPISTPPIPDGYPTPESSSPPDTREPELEADEARGRRARKSVNYAEPKLNTYAVASFSGSRIANCSPSLRKMRKPAGAELVPSTTKRKRVSTSSSSAPNSQGSDSSVPAKPTSADGIITEVDNMADLGESSPLITRRSRKVRPSSLDRDDEDESEGAQADAEIGFGVRAGWSVVTGTGLGRRKSAQIAQARIGVITTETMEQRRHSIVV
jgi:hypothetical protein